MERSDRVEKSLGVSRVTTVSEVVEEHISGGRMRYKEKCKHISLTDLIEQRTDTFKASRAIPAHNDVQQQKWYLNMNRLSITPAAMKINNTVMKL